MTINSKKLLYIFKKYLNCFGVELLFTIRCNCIRSVGNLLGIVVLVTSHGSSIVQGVDVREALDPRASIFLHVVALSSGAVVR